MQPVNLKLASNLHKNDMTPAYWEKIYMSAFLWLLVSILILDESAKFLNILAKKLSLIWGH
jgi:hypothetical protein